VMMPPAVCAGYCNNPSNSLRTSPLSLGRIRWRGWWPIFWTTSVRSSADSPVRISAARGGSKCSRIAARRRIIEQFNDPRSRQHRNDSSGFRQGQLIQELGQIGRREISDDLADSHLAFIESRVNALQKCLKVWYRHAPPRLLFLEEREMRNGGYSPD